MNILSILLMLLVFYSCGEPPEWSSPYRKCLRKETYTYMVAVPIGKITSIQPRVGTRCVEYSDQYYIDNNKSKTTYVLVVVIPNKET